MKSIILFVFLAFFFSCSKKQEKVIQIDNSYTPAPETAPIKFNPTSSKYNTFTYFHKQGDFQVTGQFLLYYNENHKNGYVVISEISIYGNKYNVTEKDPVKYIENMSTGNIEISYSSQNVGLLGGTYNLKNCPEEVLWAFRTAEAAVVAYLDDPAFTEERVYLFGKMMEGRTSGFPR